MALLALFTKDSTLDSRTIQYYAVHIRFPQSEQKFLETSMIFWPKMRLSATINVFSLSGYRNSSNWKSSLFRQNVLLTTFCSVFWTQLSNKLCSGRMPLFCICASDNLQRHHLGNCIVYNNTSTSILFLFFLFWKKNKKRDSKSFCVTKRGRRNWIRKQLVAVE